MNRAPSLTGCNLMARYRVKRRRLAWIVNQMIDLWHWHRRFIAENLCLAWQLAVSLKSMCLRLMQSAHISAGRGLLNGSAG